MKKYVLRLVDLKNSVFESAILDFSYSFSNISGLSNTVLHTSVCSRYVFESHSHFMITSMTPLVGCWQTFRIQYFFSGFSGNIQAPKLKTDPSKCSGNHRNNHAIVSDNNVFKFLYIESKSQFENIIIDLVFIFVLLIIIVENIF